MKIALIQYYTSNVNYGKYSEAINEEYCKIHGYTYVVEKDDTKIFSVIEDRHPTWYKSKMALEVFEKEEPDWILFLDADALISDFNQKIEEHIDESYNIILSDDVGHHSDYNAGVFLVKNCDWSKQFLSEWFESSSNFKGSDAKELNIASIAPEHLDTPGVFKTLLWHDQTCLTLLAKKPEVKAKIKQVSRRTFNHTEYKDKNFIFHAYSKGLRPYRTLDICYNTVFGDKQKEEKINLVVYHASGFGNYLTVADKQLKRLVSSGVYDWADKIVVTFIDTTGDFSKFEQLTKEYTKIELFTYKDNDYEYQAINKIWEYSQKYDGNVLYFHSKGVWNNFKSTLDTSLSEWKQKGVGLWKEMMEYFLIDNYKDCVEKLNHYDQCGMTCDNSSWWWGNFWWSRLDWIRINKQPQKGSRWDYEGWINRDRPTPETYEFYHIDYNPYYTVLPEDIHYTSYNDSFFEVTKAFYGVLGEQQDEGYPVIERVVADVTEIVRKNVEERGGKSICIPANNETFGDPIFGFKKMLEVHIKLNGRDYVLVQYENSLLNFSL